MPTEPTTIDQDLVEARRHSFTQWGSSWGSSLVHRQSCPGCQALSRIEAALREKDAEDSAVEFVSRNRGISGFIADYDPNRSVDDWEDFVRDLLAKLTGSQKREKVLKHNLQTMLDERGVRIAELEAVLREVLRHETGGSDGRGNITTTGAIVPQSVLSAARAVLTDGQEP